MDQPKISELLGGFKQCLFSPTRLGIFGMMIQSDELIFFKMVKMRTKHHIAPLRPEVASGTGFVDPVLPAGEGGVR